ncbi:hypothetical protein SOV_09590 [Sporomusa ovata DSM 2662]|uniref:Transcriptional regulator, MarR family n=2 Tax=Sporomusa ovata TaxID=2378 RepID=A0A0U1L5K1_9FIRM|nr:MarR family transcriptional regulator [Sporomusa ovata]EQB28608.1 transcriptional regulator [Sporomusa ovata DSM 2662]CQR74940.1 Transcriptional regulator, MarR family [Sporomusa ovata]
MITNLMDQLVKIAYKLTELESTPIDFGTDELLYPSEIHTIDAIGDQCDTVTAISLKFGITKGAVSQVILKLHKKGYVHKVRNIAYSKEILLSLTEKGMTAYRAHKKLHKTMDVEMVQLIGGYSDEDLLTFQNMLIQLEKQVNKYILLGKKN